MDITNLVLFAIAMIFMLITLVLDSIDNPFEDDK